MDCCSKPVAIVGIATEFPSGSYANTNLSHKAFFQFLLDKGESYKPIPKERFNIDSWQGKGLGQVNTTGGSFLKDIDMFDPVEFGITTKDATAMAVSTRKLIETSFLALLDSGIDYRGQNVGCYMSAVALDIFSVADPDEFDALGSFGGGACMVANRVSYHLDLLGPSIPMDTACSSTLTAMHLAVQALRTGDCEAAIVGGAQINLRLIEWIQYSQGHIISPDGKCKPFDASADGFGRGEGVGVVVLKPLEDAIRDGDHIYASILGTGINATGSAAPVNAPVAESQRDAMRRAYRGTGRFPSEVDFVELHATGTAAGDPAEANWVGADFQRDDELVIGGVKGNIGHLEITAFLASLSKVCSMFEMGLVPPNVNISTPNPAISWAEYRLRVLLETEHLRARSISGRPLASISSSGIGGANGHALLEAPPARLLSAIDESHEPRPILLTVGGLTPRSASANAEMLKNSVEIDQDQLTELSVSCGRRVRQMTWRSFAVVVPGEKSTMCFTQPKLSHRIKPPLVFVFTGQGPQHIQMGRKLFKTYPVFRDSILKMDEISRPLWGHSFIERTGLFADAENADDLPDIWPCTVTLPSLVMIQIALVDLLESVGVRPDIVLGHSAGEVAMLYASGAASKSMVIEMVVARAKAMSVVEKIGGTMAAFACDAAKIQTILQDAYDGDAAGKLELACYNTQDAVAIAGLQTYVDKAVELAQTQGIFARKLKTRLPVHSSLMEICEEQYQKSMFDLFARYPGVHEPSVTTYSTSTGAIHMEAFTADYFWANTRHPVLFSQTMSTLLSDFPEASFLEISPHPSLSSYLSSLGASTSKITCPMRRSKVYAKYDETRSFLESLGHLITMGHRSIDFVALNAYGGTLQRHIEPLPYPFVKKHVPYLPDSSIVLKRQLQARNGPLNHPYLRINHMTHPELSEHVIKGEPIMPAAGYIEMALEFGARMLWNVKFHSMMSLSKDKPLVVDVHKNESYWSVESVIEISTTPDNTRNSEKVSQLHVDGCMSTRFPTGDFLPLDLDAIRNRCSPFSLQGFYKKLETFATYGPTFRRIIECWQGQDETLVKVRGVEDDLPDASRYVIHPAILDACIHVMVHPTFTSNADPNVYYLPADVELVLVHERLADRKLSSNLYCHTIFREWQPDRLLMDFVITDDGGERLCTLERFGVAMHQHSLLPSVTHRFDLVHQPYFAPCRSLQSDRNSFNHSAIQQLHSHDDHGDTNSLLERWLGSEDDDIHTLEDPITECINAFKGVVDHLVTTVGKRVVRVLEIGVGTSLTARLADVRSTYKDVHFLHLVGAKSLSAAIEACRKSTGTSSPGQPILFNLSKPTDHDLAYSSFDIIVGFQGLTQLPNQSQSLTLLRRLLIPGGALIITEPDEILKSNLEVPLVKWSNRLSKQSSFHRTHLPYDDSLCTWHRTFEEADFAHVQIKYLSTGDSAFVTIGAQRPSLQLPLTALPSGDVPLSMPFTIGDEMSIQSTIAALEAPTDIWFTATEGKHGDAACGFTRSLRRELISWRIYVVVFNDSWDVSQRIEMIKVLSQMEGIEYELFVDSTGQVLVPRIVSSTAPNNDKPPVKSDLWMKKDSSICPVNPPTVPPNHVLVRIEMLSQSVEGLNGLIGVVIDSGATSISPGTRILAVASKVNANFALIHEGTIFVLAKDEHSQDLASLVVALVGGALALKIKSFDHLARLKSRRVLINHDNREVGSTLMRFYHALGLQPVGFGFDQAELAAEQKALRINEDDIIMTSGKSPFLKASISPRARLFSIGDIVEVLHDDPWSIGDALQITIPKLKDVSFECSFSQPPEEILRGSTQGIQGADLFDCHKSYLLLGGISSLGVHLALWMYQKGARHVVLTSRSGRDSLVRVQNVLSLRILAYLESLPDLTLRLEASDASSKEHARELIKTISPPLAGCMLLSAVLADNLFLSQKEEDFRTAMAAKLGAFEAIEDVFPIETLDFFIAFSSITSIGNAGQTNYTSANAVINGITQKYRNAFSILAPPILDSNIAIADAAKASRLQHLFQWSLTARELCLCLEDGILKLTDGPFGLYIPDLKWNLVQLHMGSPNLFNHLIREEDSTSVQVSNDSGPSPMEIVLKHLDVKPDEFSQDVPFTMYGMDLLSAARLAFDLQPIVPVTQLQLLGHVSYKDLERRIEEQRKKRGVQLGSDERSVHVANGKEH